MDGQLVGWVDGRLDGWSVGLSVGLENLFEDDTGTIYGISLKNDIGDPNFKG